MSNQEYQDPKMTRKQNELNLYKFGQYCAKKMDEEIDLLAVEHPDTPDLTELDEWFQGYLEELDVESKKIIRRVKYRKIASRAAIVFVALVLSSVVVTFSVEAFRIKFFNIFIETKSDNNQLDFHVDEESYKLPESWDSYYFPSYLPDSYSLLDFQDNGEMKLLFFTDLDGKTLMFTQSESDMSILVDNEDADMEHVIINDVEAYLTNKNGFVTVSWAANGMIFTLDGEEESEEMLEIARKIKKVFK